MQENQKQKYTLSILIENEFGALSRVAVTLNRSRSLQPKMNRCHG